MGKGRSLFTRFLADYGILLALVLLCVFFSWVTYTEQRPFGAAGGAQLSGEILRRFPKGSRVLIVAGASKEDDAFAEALRTGLEAEGDTVAATVTGQPADAREALERIAAGDGRLDVVACDPTSAAWSVFDGFAGKFPRLASARVV